MPGVSIHVVDVSRGVVAAGMEVELHAVDAGGRLALIGLLDAPELSKTFAPGGYVAVFQVAGFYRAQGIALPAVPFLDVVRFHFVHFRPGAALPPAVQSTPWGYSCFRGGA